MKVHPSKIIGILIFVIFAHFTSLAAKNVAKQRVIVSTDIGGTDFDDYQSLVHLLLYADTFDIEGILASPYGEGRTVHILEAIDAYEIDYPNLIAHSNAYPSPNALRKVVKQGAIDSPSFVGYSTPTEGSEWIITCAKKDDLRPLNVLIWGGIEDLAQALHDAPDILPKLRVHFIGGPNKKWSVNAYQYIAQNFPNLWIIESNATYRGWFVGGNQHGEWGNEDFVETYVKNAGALGGYFYKYGRKIKMGDTPSFTYLFNGNPADPTQPSWGGHYVRAWKRPYKVYKRITNKHDSIERFGVLELRIQIKKEDVAKPFAVLHIDRPINGLVENDTVRFLFSPKNASTYTYSIKSNISSINKEAGSITSYQVLASNKQYPSSLYPNWWTDDPSPEFKEKGHIGIKTVNVWREDFLRDFAKRLARCNPVPPKKRMNWRYLNKPLHATWYLSDEAQEIADNMLLYQSIHGAWPKNVDLTVAPTSKNYMEEIDAEGKSNTIDNGATTRPMIYLAKMAQATGKTTYKTAFLHGLDYLLEAQYSNGGWPQFYPLRERGYYSEITFNDNAMMNVMYLLNDISQEKPLYDLVDVERRKQTRKAVEKGIDCILKTQLKVNGTLTVWCAQYDEITLKPAWARAYEPPSLSGAESVDIIRFLMQIEEPNKKVKKAIKAGVAWFETTKITGYRYIRGRTENGERDGWIEADLNASALWARFYDIETNQPIFLGRDSEIHYNMNEVEQERRAGYSYYGTWAKQLLEVDYPSWLKKVDE